MDRAAAASGLLPWEADELTFGELLERLEGQAQQERKRLQWEALIAYREAGLLATMLSGRRAPELYEVFPLWEETEIGQMKLEKYRRIMERHAAAGRGG